MITLQVSASSLRPSTLIDIIDRFASLNLDRMDLSFSLGDNLAFVVIENGVMSCGMEEFYNRLYTPKFVILPGGGVAIMNLWGNCGSLILGRDNEIFIGTKSHHFPEDFDAIAVFNNCEAGIEIYIPEWYHTKALNEFFTIPQEQGFREEDSSYKGPSKDIPQTGKVIETLEKWPPGRKSRPKEK